MKRNVKMAGLVAGVALAAVVGGALVAAQQTPELASASGDASPIGGSGAPVGTPSAGTPTVHTPKPSATPQVPSSRPSTRTTAKPTAPADAPVKVRLDLTKLTQGKAPAVPYAEGHTVHHAGRAFTVDASDGEVSDVVRAGTGVLVRQHSLDGKLRLVSYSGDGQRGESVADVHTVRSSADGGTSAYSIQPDDGSGTGPVTLVWRDNDSGRDISLLLKGMTSVEVLAVDGRYVYYSAGATGSAPKLYRWTASQPHPFGLTHVVRPTAVSRDAHFAASLLSIDDGGSCTALVEISSGTRAWRTCDYQVDAVQTDSDYVLGGPAYRDGYADGHASALDVKSGRLIREWAGLSFISTAMEDGEHMLMLVENDTSTAIVRCAPRSGRCELATPLKKGTGQQDEYGRRPYAMSR